MVGLLAFLGYCVLLPCGVTAIWRPCAVAMGAVVFVAVLFLWLLVGSEVGTDLAGAVAAKDFLVALPVLGLLLVLGRALWRVAKARGLRQSAGTVTPRNPWMALVLNVLPIPLGLGYIYLGLPRAFVVAFAGLVPCAMAFGVIGLWFLLATLNQYLSLGAPTPYGVDDAFFGVSLVWVSLPWVLLGYFAARDAHRRAKDLNERAAPVCSLCQRPKAPGTACEDPECKKGAA